MSLGGPGSIGLLFLLGCWLPGWTAGAELRVNEVKAAFLYNFANFVTWPRDAFESPRSPLYYCIWGTSPVRPLLADLLRGEVVNGHPLRLAPAGARDHSHCQILFVSAEVDLRAPLPRHGVLTVGETRAFLRQGGMIALVPHERRIRPLIARRTAEAAGIRISSKLLRIATLVKEAP